MNQLEPTRTNSNLTATERLRALLDERGVEHVDIGGMTEFTNADGRICRAYTRPEPMTVDVAMVAATPEMAVEATLDSCSCSNSERTGDTDVTRERQGVGTCHNTWDAELTGRLRFQCSECGAVSLEITPRFCPNCGRKVER